MRKSFVRTSEDCNKAQVGAEWRERKAAARSVEVITGPDAPSHVWAGAGCPALTSRDASSACAISFFAFICFA